MTPHTYIAQRRHGCVECENVPATSNLLLEVSPKNDWFVLGPTLIFRQCQKCSLEGISPMDREQILFLCRSSSAKKS